MLDVLSLLSDLSPSLPNLPAPPHHASPSFLINPATMRLLLPAFLPSAPVTPAKSPPPATNVPPLISPTCTLRPLPRRTFLHLLPTALVLPLLPSPSLSESLNERAIRNDVTIVLQGLSRAKQLTQTVNTWNSTLSDDDTLYILRYIPVWLEPARVAMQSVATQQRVDVGDAQVVATKAAATLGHLLELKMEANRKSKDGVLRELDEFVETANDFIALPPLERFTSAN